MLTPQDGHFGGVTALQFTPDGRQLLSAGQDYRLIRWDAVAGKELGQLAKPSCCCRRCSCISRWCFPNAPAAGSARRWGERSCRCSICRRRCSVWPASSPSRARRSTRSTSSDVVAALDRFEPLYLSICLAAGLVILIRAFGHVRSVTARRQLRWIVWGTALGALPFAIGYAVPYALGVEPSLPMELSAIPLSFVPLAFASAIVRYRLMDVEVILKRMLVWAVAIAAIVGLYAVLLNVATEGFSGNGANPNWVIALLATAVVVLLASPVKNAIQAGLDRAFYRDRYDYRRALVGFRARPQRGPRSQSAGRASRLPRDGDAAGRSHGVVHGRRRRRFHAAASGRLCDDAARTGAPVRTRWPSRGRPRGRARRPAGGAPLLRRRDRVLARLGAVLLRALHRQRRHHRHPGARAPRQRRAAEQRGHGAAGRRGRTGRDGARERPPLQPAPRRRPKSSIACASSATTSCSRSTTAWSSRTRRTHPLVEPRARKAVRRAGGIGHGTAARATSSTRASSRR